MSNGDDRETAVCEHCGATFDAEAVPPTPLPSTVLYRCPWCSRWTESD